MKNKPVDLEQELEDAGYGKESFYEEKKHEELKAHELEHEKKRALRLKHQNDREEQESRSF